MPKSKEVEKALNKLKNGKAAGNSNIMPEMLNVGRRNEDFVGMFTDLVSTVWEENRIPQEWVDSPFPRKETYTAVTIGGG